MKKIKKVIIVLAMMIAMAGFVNPMTVDASRTYKVTFRAGAHGTFAANYYRCSSKRTFSGYP